MSVFQNADEFYACIGGVLEKIRRQPEAYEQVADSGIVMRFRYLEPAAIVTVDARPGHNDVLYGESDLPADVELTMHADLAHRFWMGELNVVAEVMAGRIAFRGPLSKLSRLLPLLRSVRALYAEHLCEIGYRHLLGSAD